MTGPAGPPVFVLSGTRTEYTAWCRQQGLHPGDRAAVRWVGNAEVFRGLRTDQFRVVTVGTWATRPDLPLIGHALRAAQTRTQQAVSGGEPGP